MSGLPSYQPLKGKSFYLCDSVKQQLAGRIKKNGGNVHLKMHHSTKFVVCNRAEFGRYYETLKGVKVSDDDYEAIESASKGGNNVLDPRCINNITWNTVEWGKADIIDWASTYQQKEDDSQQRSEDLIQQIKVDGLPRFSSLLERAMEDVAKNASTFERRATDLVERLQDGTKWSGIVNELTKMYQSDLESYNFTLDVAQRVIGSMQQVDSVCDIKTKV